MRDYLVSAEGERWMTVAEIADYLLLSRAKVYEMAQNGQIPCTNLAGRWRNETIGGSRDSPPTKIRPRQEAPCI